LYKAVIQLDNAQIWLLTSIAPVTWSPWSGSGVNPATLTAAILAEISTSVPNAIVIGGSGAAGSVGLISDSGHIHPFPAFGSTSGTVVQGNDARIGGIATATTTVSLAAAAAPTAGQIPIASNGTTATWGTNAPVWGNVSGKPSTFAPSTHASTHITGGSDPIPVATQTTTGLLPIVGASGTVLIGAVNPTWSQITDNQISSGAAIQLSKLYAGGGGSTAILYTVDGTTVGTTLVSDALVSTSASIAVSKLAHGATGTFLQTNGSTISWAALPFAAVQTALGGASGSISVNSQLLTNGITPVAGTDYAIKSYVDSVASGFSVKASVSAMSVSNISSMSGLATTVDGVLLNTDGMRVLLNGQTTQTQNGIWVVHSGAWTRATDMVASSSAAGAFVPIVTGGTIYGGQTWACNTPNGSAVVGTNNLTFTYFTSPVAILAGNGLTKVGNTISAVANADGSIVVSSTDIKVGVITATEHGNQTTGTLHALANNTTAGFVAAVGGTANVVLRSTDGTNQSWGGIVDAMVTSVGWGKLTSVPTASTSVSGIVQLGGDVTGSSGSLTVAKINGVSISGTPSAGQIPIASSSTVSAWGTNAPAWGNVTGIPTATVSSPLTTSGTVIGTGSLYISSATISLPLSTTGMVAGSGTLSIAAVSNASPGIVGSITAANTVLLSTTGSTPAWGQVTNAMLAGSIAWSKITGYPTILDNISGTTNKLAKFTATGVGNSGIWSLGNIDGISLAFLQNSAEVLVGWNRSSGEGEADFVSNRGGGSLGGFAFYDINNSGTLTQLAKINTTGLGIGVNPVARLDVAGTTSDHPGRTLITDDNNHQPTLLQYKWSSTGSNYLVSGTLTQTDANGPGGGYWRLGVSTGAAAIGSETMIYPLALRSNGDVEVSGTVTTTATELILKQTGDGFGASALHVRNRSGQNGLMVENKGLDLTDIVFASSTTFLASGTTNPGIRMEPRAGSYVVNSGELQLGKIGTPSLVVGYNVPQTRLTASGIVTDQSNLTFSTVPNSGIVITQTQISTGGANAQPILLLAQSANPGGPDYAVGGDLNLASGRFGGSQGYNGNVNIYCGVRGNVSGVPTSGTLMMQFNDGGVGEGGTPKILPRVAFETGQPITINNNSLTINTGSIAVNYGAIVGASFATNAAGGNLNTIYVTVANATPPTPSSGQGTLYCQSGALYFLRADGSQFHIAG
jgi:hypothetical protein